MNLARAIRGLVAGAALPAALACAAAAAGAATAAGTPGASGARAVLGASAPPFAATTLDGRRVGLSTFAGKVVVLNFWATWCPPCRRETPDLVRAYQSLHARDVAFLGIDTTETAPVVKTFSLARGLPYPTALAGADVYNRYAISYIPTTVVVDARGVVRARWIGGIAPAQLAAYVASARAGRSSAYVSREQARIDAMLDLAAFRRALGAHGAHGAHDARDERDAAAFAAAARRRVAEVDRYVATLDATTPARYDVETTNGAEGTLLVAAGTALRAAAATDAERIRALRLLAAGYGLSNRWADAASADRAALRAHPRDAALTSDLATAYYRLHDYDAMARVATAWTALAPADPDAFEALGRAEQRRRRFAAAVAPYERSCALLQARSERHAADPSGATVGTLADESLDLADVYVSLGDAAAARRTFDRAIRFGAEIPRTSAYAALTPRTRERAIEGMTAVALANHRGTSLSLTAWTGADLPGSLASTFKYRLVVVAPPNRSVRLTARGLRHGWIASFCADGLCSPRTVAFVSPASGIRTYEFQLVPPVDGALPAPAVVSADDGASATTPALDRRR